MANTLTDLIMIYALQGKAYYKEHKYETSMDFSHIRREIDEKGVLAISRCVVYTIREGGAGNQQV
jgi:hypothetical protein